MPGHDRSVTDRIVAAFSLRFEGRNDATDIEPDKMGFVNIQGHRGALGMPARDGVQIFFEK
jgi:hypothetical protein